MWKLLRGSKASLAALLFLVLLAVGSWLVPVWAGDSLRKLDFERRLLPPLSAGHLLGTDPLGRDVLARIFKASRVSLGLSVGVVALSAAMGTALGMLAGYVGGWLDDAVMRLTDVALGFPTLLLALTVIYALGPSVRNMVVVLAFSRWMLFAQVARAETMRLKRVGYVEAARSVGASGFRIARLHILPGLASLLATLAVTELGAVMLSESTLSFLGLGIQPPEASLGLLVAQGKEYITAASWLIMFPGLVIFSVTMALGVLASWLGMALDPVQRWRLQ